MQIQELRDKYGEQIIALAKSHGVDNIRVFGSVARGEATEKSDIDLLVHLCEGTSLLSLAKLDRKLRELTGLKVDIVPDDCLYEDIAPYILQDAIPL